MNQTLTQIQEEFDEKFTYQKPTRKYGKILYATPVLLASVDEIKSFLTQSNLRVIEKVKQELSEKIFNLETAESNPYYKIGYKQAKTEALGTVLNFDSTLIEQK